MKVLNFSDEEILNIVRLLAAILHLGNVKYNGLVIGKFSKFVIFAYLLM
jgi:myosin heavy subunit